MADPHPDPHVWKDGETNFKPPRGTRILQREETKRERTKHEDEAIAAAKKRDGYKCRWPEKHVCRGGFLEGAHLTAKGMGGDPQARVTTRQGIVTLCPWIHRRGPKTLERHELKIEAETAAGADGPLSFWRQDGGRDALGEPTYYLVARERAIGVVEKD